MLMKNEQMDVLKAIFDKAPFGACIVDLDGDITYVNQSFNTVVESGSRTLVGRPVLDLASEVIQDDALLSRIRRLLETADPFALMIETWSSPLLRTSNFINLFGYRVDGVNILIADLIGGGDRYTKIIQEALDAIIIIRDGIISFSNSSFASMLDMKPEMIVGRAIAEFLEGSDKQALDVLNDAKVKELSLQISVRTPNGKRVLDGRFHSVEDRPGTTIAILRDITEDVALERRLLRQNQDLAVINLISEVLSSSLQLKEVLESTLGKILQVMNIETGWIFILNEETQTLKCVYSYGLPDYVMQSLRELRVGEGIAGRVAVSWEPIIIENASEDPRIKSLAFKEQGIKSFASIPLKSRTRLIGVMNIGSFGQRILSVDDKRLLLNIGLHMGTVIENVLLFEEVKQKSEELSNALDVIEQRNDELKNLIDTVSHDLKNPLIAVNGFCKRLLKSAGDKLSERELEYVKAIDESGRTMENFVHNLLSVSAAERQKIENENFAVSQLLEEIVRQVVPQLDAKRGRIEIAEDMPELTADKTRVMQIFSNLITNAIKYSHPERQPHIRVGSQPHDTGHLFFVRDNGIGIGQEYIDNVFDIFFRAYEDIAEGTGIGLSIVKKAVKAMGGRIWLESTEGEGSTFYFTIPQDKSVDS